MSSNLNGCGPKGILGKLVPDHLLGLSVIDACNHHDDLYSEGGDSNKRKLADKVFLSQMLKNIHAARDDGKLVTSLRKMKAYIYYLSARLWGKYFYHYL